MNQQTEKKSIGKSALAKMTTAVPVANQSSSLKTMESGLRQNMRKYDTINYIYAVDDNNVLVGALSIKDIFALPPTKKVSEVMVRGLVSVHPHTHQETVAMLAIKHNIKAIPVVDKEGKFLGVVPSDTILNILHSEHIEDALHAAGIHKFKDPALDIINADAFTHFQKRLPWLVLGLVGGILAAFVVGSFEAALQSQLLLAAFIPTVVYIADAVGAQTQTIFIRSLALQQKLNFKQYLSREVVVSFMLAVILAIIGAGLSFIWLNLPVLGLVLGLSIFATAFVASGIAVFLPWLFLKINQDPAVASGPFATVLRDILSILIYFSIATSTL